MNAIITSGKFELECETNDYGELWLTQNSAKSIEKVVKSYMRAEVEDHVDHQTNEVNYTHLAEDAADHFQLYGPADYQIPTQVYDWGIEVGLDWERDHQVD